MDCRVKPGMTIFASKSMQADADRKRDDAEHIEQREC
jgi:hypothetical protein